MFYLSSSGYVRLTELAKVEFQKWVTNVRRSLFLWGNKTQSKGESRARRSSSKARVDRLCRQPMISPRSFSNCRRQKKARKHDATHTTRLVGRDAPWPEAER